MDEFYNRHYIRVREDGAITGGWSDGPHNHREVTEEDILLNGKGGYQFRLILDGEPTEENPPLTDMDGIPLYRWTGSEAVRRTEEEIESERASRPGPEAAPTQLDHIEAQTMYTALMTDTLLEE